MRHNTKLILPSQVSSLSRLNRILSGPKYQGCKFIILLDGNTYTYCMPEVISRMTALHEAEFLEVPVGEETKSIEIATQIWGGLIEMGADRNTVLVNVGGGTVSDLGGFVASCYKRGIRYINIPTTLIGMVDAAIGGKTAINIENLKNQVGSFFLPEITCIEPDLLATLPEQEMIGGLFETIKTLMLSGSEMYETLCHQILSGNVDISNEIIGECAQFKYDVAKADTRDTSIRKILNFGHTFGHAFESFHMNTPEPLSHGQCVGLGMWCALYLSVKKMGLPNGILEGYQNIMLSMIKPKKYSLKDTEELLTYMRADKKNENDLILCVLMQELGAPVIDVSVEENEIRDTILSLAKLS